MEKLKYKKDGDLCSWRSESNPDQSTWSFTVVIDYYSPSFISEE